MKKIRITESQLRKLINEIGETAESDTPTDSNGQEKVSPSGDDAKAQRAAGSALSSVGVPAGGVRNQKDAQKVRPVINNMLGGDGGVQEGYYFTKGQIKENRIKQMRKNSFCFRKGDLKK